MLWAAPCSVSRPLSVSVQALGTCPLLIQLQKCNQSATKVKLSDPGKECTNVSQGFAC